MTRPGFLLAIAGTGTEIGKTWAACRLLETARQRGLTVAARKPAQSFERDASAPTDAEQLARATGEAAHTVCPAHRWYPVAMAPPMAADVLNRERMLLGGLLEEITWPSGIALGCVETAGGLRSPITHDADNVELIQRLRPDAVLLVADAGLGTINSVRLSLEALQGPSVCVYLNRFDRASQLHVRNREWLTQVYRCDVVTEADAWLARSGLLTSAAGTSLDRPSRD